MMSQLIKEWRERLRLPDPYDHFHPNQYPLDLQGWGSHHPIFEKLITTTEPKVIIEVGTWKGASALHMASLLREKSLDSIIICVDTWLGGIEHLMRTDDFSREQFTKSLQNGYPTLYFQFLANVSHLELQDYIIPIPNTSTIASKYLAAFDVQSDLIYIDAGYDEESVFQDISHYWKLLKPNGIIFGDDWDPGWYGVICAVNQFSKEQSIPFKHFQGKWLMHKPPSLGSKTFDNIENRLTELELRISDIELYLMSQQSRSQDE
ncbi:MAG: class I SAM-dependent methyltransferase [Cyanobacteriota bacterium]|nr:class I SAM-dependent methyltransferase [Cyanobacteriota bacterium]